MVDELTDALEKMIDAARTHLQRVRDANGRVDDESVWDAYVRLNNAACEYDELLRTKHDEVTPFDVEPMEAEDVDSEWSAPVLVQESVEPDAEPTLIGVRQRRDYLVPSGAALIRVAEHARSQVIDPDSDDQPLESVGDAVLELLHCGDGTLRCLEVPELVPLDGITVVNDIVEGIEVSELPSGQENDAFYAGPNDLMVGRLDERSLHLSDQRHAMSDVARE